MLKQANRMNRCECESQTQDSDWVTMG